MIIAIFVTMLLGLSLAAVALILIYFAERFTSFAGKNKTPAVPLADNHILSFVMAFVIMASTVGVLYYTGAI